jgi:hypothetical protein
MSASGGGTPVLRETRWLAVFIIPFLAVAFIVLYLFPTETARLFAWEIKPPMSAMMLGAAYLGGVWFFGRAARAGLWDEITVGFPAVAAFACILGVATFLHWDRFIHESLAFILWTILYVTTPFLVLGTWIRQRRHAAGTARAASRMLPTSVRSAVGVIGAAMIGVSAALFVAPALMGPTWPWALTPLTTRVMSAMFALPGLVGLGIALDGRWIAARIVIEAQILAVAFIVLAPLLHPEGIDFGLPQAWVFFVGLSVLVVLLVVLSVTMRRRDGPATT